MALHYKVVDDAAGSVLFETDTNNGWDVFDWMMEHIDECSSINETFTEEYTDGECTGYWSAKDLLEENPDGYWLPGGTVKIVLNDDGETYRRERA